MSADAPLLKTTPYWWEAAPVQPLPARPLEKTVDVAIVGAGYAGLSAGITLARAGRSVAVFDRQHPGEGASSRNGGITSGNIRLDNAALVRKFGQDRANRIEAEGKQARQYLYDLIADEGIDCDFKAVGRFTGLMGPKEYESHARNADKLHRTLGVESYAVPRSEQRDYIGTDFFHGGTVRMDIGGLHPAKFMAEMLRVALAAGVVVHSDTPVVSIKQQAERHTITTTRGEVSAEKVMICTNGYTDQVDPWLRRRIVPVRSRMIATQELSPDLMAELMPKLMMMSDTRVLGFYFRPSPDGKRILLGGRDGTTLDDPTRPVAHLRENLIEIFPQLAETRITHSWFGNIAMHRDMLPRIFERDGMVYATGFCGSGVVWAPWIGYKGAQKLLGAKNEAASAFDFRAPSSVPFYTGKPWFMPFFMAMYRMQDYVNLRRAGR